MQTRSVDVAHTWFRAAARLGVLVVLLTGTVSAYAQVPRIYAINGARLVSFSADTPGTFLTDIPIIGLNPGTSVVAIDFIPRTEELIGVIGVRDTGGVESIGLANINRTTGAFTVIPPGFFNVSGGGGSYDFGVSINGLNGFMQIAKRRRNMAVVPYSTFGAISQTDFAYAVGDVGFGTLPNIVGLAHTPSVGISQLNTLYGISLDASNAATLVRIGGADGTAPFPAFGQVFTIGSLGAGIVIADGVSGFDIQAGTNTAYLTLRPDTFRSNLHTVNLATGAATLIGEIGASRAGASITGIAIAPPNQCLDIDGDGIVLPATDGLILVRVLLGMTGAAVLNGAQPAFAARSTWPAIRDHLNSICGMNLAL